MSKSIISIDRKCYVCGTTQNLHKHHCIFGVANRRLSEKYGLWVYLCIYHHTEGKEAVHNNRELDLKLKEECQRRFEENGTREEFVKIFGRNYL